MKKILLVDDEAAFTKFVKFALEKTGKYLVRAENEAAGALGAAREFRPDIVFLDVMMPGTGGEELARLIRSDASLRDVPVIFLTSVVGPGEVGPSGGVIGGQTFLAKSQNVEPLISCIEKHARPAGGKERDRGASCGR